MAQKNPIGLRAIAAIMFIGSIAFSTPAAIVLDVSPASYSQLTANGAVLLGNVQLVTGNGSPYVDFGTTGQVRFPSFRFPKTSYTIEALVNLRAYPTDAEIVSTLVGNYYWNSSVTQGVNFCIGGGYLYPILPEQAYAGTFDFVKPAMDRYERAHVSNSIASLTQGALNTYGGAWREVFAGQSIPLDEWVYLVGTWDGTAERVFINGREVNDAWRTQGAQLIPNIDSAADLYIGGWLPGERHFNGMAQFVRVHNTALNSDEIMSRYGTIAGGCNYWVKIKRPLVGEIIAATTEFELEIVRSGNCRNGDSVVGDTFEVGISSNPHFDDASGTVTFSVGGKTFSFETCGKANAVGQDGVKYVRVACKNCRDTVLSKTTAGTNEVSSQVPVFFVQNANSINRGIDPSPLQPTTNFSGSSKCLTGLTPFTRVRIVGISGRVTERLTASQEGTVSLSQPRQPGVYFIRAGGKTYTVTVGR